MIRTLILATCMLCCARLWAQHPAGYANVKEWTNFAEFALQGSTREILSEKGVTFTVDRDVQLEFQVLVNPEGQVLHVRVPRCPTADADFRRGGADALYGFVFKPLPAEAGDQWINVRMTVRPEQATPQAQ